MTETDEAEIRNLVANWFNASKRGDVGAVLELMTDDVVFMTVGREPFGKETFRVTSERLNEMHIDGTYDIKEITVLGDFAYMRNYLEVSVTTPEGDKYKKIGYVLSILRKDKEKGWRISRDANLLV